MRVREHDAAEACVVKLWLWTVDYWSRDDKNGDRTDVKRDRVWYGMTPVEAPTRDIAFAKAILQMWESEEMTFRMNDPDLRVKRWKAAEVR